MKELNCEKQKRSWGNHLSESNNLWAGPMAYWVKVPGAKSWTELNPWAPNHARRELTLINCPLTSTHLLRPVSTHLCTKTKKNTILK